jgi:hypothetical protein
MSPECKVLQNSIRAAMSEIVETNRRQLHAMIRGDHKTFMELGSKLETLRSRTQRLVGALNAGRLV